MGFGIHTGTPNRILRQVQTMEYQVCRMWTGGTLAWALSSKKVTSCRISEHAPEQERDDTYVLCGSALTGATRGNSEASRQNHCYGESGHVTLAERRPFASPSASGRSDHDRFTGSTPDRVRDVSSRVPPLKSVSSLRSLPCAQQALPSISVR